MPLKWKVEFSIYEIGHDIYWAYNDIGILYFSANNAWNIVGIISDITFNPYHAKFLKWNNRPYIFDTVHYHI